LLGIGIQLIKFCIKTTFCIFCLLITTLFFHEVVYDIKATMFPNFFEEGDQMNIYIGNLPKDMEEEELIEMFTEYGSVKNAKIIRDRHTNISRGYGFIEMDSEEAAKEAIKDWDQGSIDDRIIRVCVAYSSIKKGSSPSHAALVNLF